MIGDLYAEFGADLEARDIFAREVERWKIKWVSADQPTKSLEKAVAIASPDVYPNVRMCLSILLGMPVSTVSAERSFLTMRRVKKLT